jgi:uncharacterized coiled-coil protein SlyX
MSTPTPRTDAAQFWDRSDYHDPSAFDWFVRAEHARTLERELAAERERSRLLLAAMNERDDGYIESRKRMSAFESELTAKSQAVRNLAEVISGQDKELAREREKVQMLRNALQSLHDEQNGAPLRRRRDHWQMAMNNASSALAATEDTP